MTFKIHRSFPYKNLKVQDGLAQIETGLLDDEECAALAKSLVDAAYDLIYDFKDETASKLVKILNEDF